jgi:hypothetical protein
MNSPSLSGRNLKGKSTLRFSSVLFLCEIAFAGPVTWRIRVFNNVSQTSILQNTGGSVLTSKNTW